MFAVDLHVDEQGTTAFRSNTGDAFSMYQTTDVVKIEQAVGWDKGAGTLSDSFGGACESKGQHGALHCKWRETFPLAAVGRHVVRCFTAIDPHGDRVSTNATLNPDYNFLDGLCQNDASRACANGGADGEDKMTCKSMPLCLKVSTLNPEP